MITPVPSTPAVGPWRRRFDRLRDGIWGILPAPLQRVIPATLVGYVLINAFTFSTDMALLTLCYRVLHIPYGFSVSTGYIIALGLAYLLNRAFNFESHSKVGGELVRYVVVVVINYTCLVLGLSKLLHGLGVQFQLARLVAATAEAAFMYTMMRFVVFRGSRTTSERKPGPDTAH
ncbi:MULTISPECIES: GtrA family protein [unclassified Luteococcus]|uniref:GtrA family protein n=1 Tax=unclassified Luteococcus TaxID=2639923 RepID=UPI00313B3B8C